MTHYDSPNFPRHKYKFGFTTGGPAPAPSLPAGDRVRRLVDGQVVTYVKEKLGNVRAFIGGEEVELSERARDLMLIGWPAEERD